MAEKTGFLTAREAQIVSMQTVGQRSSTKDALAEIAKCAKLGQVLTTLKIPEDNPGLPVFLRTACGFDVEYVIGDWSEIKVRWDK